MNTQQTSVLRSQLLRRYSLWAETNGPIVLVYFEIPFSLWTGDVELLCEESINIQKEVTNLILQMVPNEDQSAVYAEHRSHILLLNCSTGIAAHQLAHCINGKNPDGSPRFSIFETGDTLLVSHEPGSAVVKVTGFPVPDHWPPGIALDRPTTNGYRALVVDHINELGDIPIIDMADVVFIDCNMIFNCNTVAVAKEVTRRITGYSQLKFIQEVLSS